MSIIITEGANYIKYYRICTDCNRFLVLWGPDFRLREKVFCNHKGTKIIGYGNPPPLIRDNIIMNHNEYINPE